MTETVWLKCNYSEFFVLRRSLVTTTDSQNLSIISIHSTKIPTDEKTVAAGYCIPKEVC